MDVRELVRDVALDDIRCIECVASLKLDPSTGLEDWSPGEAVGDLKLDVNPVSWGKRLESWFRLSLDNPVATIAAAYSVAYTRESDEVIPEDVQQSFLEAVAVMACLPYLRESIQRMGFELRLGNILVPIVRQGELHIDLRAKPGNEESNDRNQ